jgi:hypothetical protein
MSALPHTPVQIPRELSETRARTKRPLRCVSCGYEIVNYRLVPDCPMCREFHWEPAPWRPFTKQRVLQRHA